MKWKELLPLMVLFSLILTSCGTATPPTPGGNPDIEIQMTGSEPEVIDTETMSQNNCGGNVETQYIVTKSRTIEYVIEVQNEMSVDAKGKVGIAGTGVDLGTTVAAKFGQSYGTSDTISRSIAVGAQPGTNMQHVIRQMEIWKTGEAKVTVNGQQATIPFKFRSDFAIELAGSNPVPCDGTPTGVPIDTPVGPAPESTSTAVMGLPVGMDVRLVADKTDGKHPVTVNFNAKGSFFRDAKGEIYPCGLCNYTWSVYQGGNLINAPKWDDAGTFNYRFGKAGDYRVVVTVCRKQSDTDCGYGAEDIAVR